MAEVYKKFSEILQTIVVHLFQACLDEHELPEMWSQA